jgi:hypothetical protein
MSELLKKIGRTVRPRARASMAQKAANFQLIVRKQWRRPKAAPLA